MAGREQGARGGCAVKHIVLLNSGAGTADGDAVAAIQKRFHDHGVTADVRVLEHGTDIRSAAAAALGERPDVIVAGGGDGTLNAVADVIAGQPVVFGVLPLGTLNHFAKDLGIPLDVDGAVDTICGGRTKDVDVGRVNGRLFLNNSSLGLYPQVVRERDQLRERLGRGKWPAYLWAAAAVLRRFPFVEVHLQIDDKAAFYRTPLVFIGNNSYELTGINLGARACLDAGHLGIYVVKRTTRLALLLLALRAVFGRLPGSEDFVSFCATNASVQTRRRSVAVATDGEVRRLNTPLRYEVQPRALRVLVPAPESVGRA